MLGLIDGASIGMTVEPPVTVGELERFGIEAFYAIDYSPSGRRRGAKPQRLTPGQYRALQGLARHWRNSRLQTIRDTAYMEKLQAGFARQMKVPNARTR
jgi:hypothetical protein